MLKMLEEVGFELKQSFISWCYASGFPKAYDVAKAIESRIKLGTANWSRWDELEGEGELKSHLGYHKSQAEQKYRPKDYTEKKRPAKIKLTTDLARKWKGYKSVTGLKPAFECVLMVNKPFSEKTIVDNVLKWGTGAINVDACRIPYEKPYKPQKRGSLNSSTPERKYGYKELVEIGSEKGRFPANLLVSDNDIGKITRSHKRKTVNPTKGGTIFGLGPGEYAHQTEYDDEGDFSRFFSLDAWWREWVKKLPKEARKTFPFLIVPKASKSERDKGLEKMPYVESGSLKGSDDGSLIGERGRRKEGKPPLRKNFHPTVKPVKLMAYLIELGCPPGGVVLDPFVGSGTTCMAAKMLGRKYIGIEINSEYVEIARARVAAVPFTRRLDEFVHTL